MSLITVGLIIAVPVLGNGNVLTYQRGYYLPSLTIALAGGLEACFASGDQDQTPLAVLKRVGANLGTFFLGMAMMVVILTAQLGNRTNRA